MKVNGYVAALIILPLIALDILALNYIFFLISYPNTLIMLVGLLLISALIIANYLLLTKIKLK